MKIVNGYDLLEYAKQRKLLLPAFNTTNLEMTKAIIKGLNDVHLPGMVQISSVPYREDAHHSIPL